MAAYSACEVFSWCRCLVVGLVFSRLGFWSGSLFLIAPFSDLCLFVLFFRYTSVERTVSMCTFWKADEKRKITSAHFKPSVSLTFIPLHCISLNISLHLYLFKDVRCQ